MNALCNGSGLGMYFRKLLSMTRRYLLPTNSEVAQSDLIRVMTTQISISRLFS